MTNSNLHWLIQETFGIQPNFDFQSMALERGIPIFCIGSWAIRRRRSWCRRRWGFLFGTLAICLLLFLIVPFICFVDPVAAVWAERGVLLRRAVDLHGGDGGPAAIFAAAERLPSRRKRGRSSVTAVKIKPAT